MYLISHGERGVGEGKNKSKHKALLDTGAFVNAVTPEVARRNGLTVRPCAIKELKMANGAAQPVVGETRCDVIINNAKYSTTFIVASLNHDVILGRPFLCVATPTIDFGDKGVRHRHAGIAAVSEETASQQIAQEMQALFPKVFEAPTYLVDRPNKFTHKIELTEKNPFLPNILPAKLAPRDKKAIDDEVVRLLNAGFIEKSKAHHGCRALVVPKGEDDKEVRVVYDMRPLNRVTKPMGFPCPNAEQLQEEMQDMAWGTSLDLASAYNQIPLDKKSRPLTTFNCHRGKFQWRTVPFGCLNGSSALMNMMQSIFADLDFVKVYADDIAIVTKGDMTDHIAKVKIALKVLLDNDLKVNLKKCKFARTAINFCGLRIEKGHVSVMPQRAEAVRKLKPPKDIQGVQSFLGLTNYYAKFIPNYANIALPLSDLLRGDKVFVFEEPQRAAWQSLKDAISVCPVLRLPVPGAPFKVRVDASDDTVAAVMSQDLDDGQGERPCAYMSHKLTQSAQSCWTVRDKELYSIVAAFKTWRPWLLGARTTVLTDHQSLPSLFKNADWATYNGRLARWCEFLSDYDMEVVWIKGADNAADVLSRQVAPITPVTKVAGSETLTKEIIEAGYEGYNKKLTRISENEDGILFRDHRICIPLVGPLRNRIISENHASALAGHFAAEKVYAKISERYFWPRMYEDIKEFTSACDVCQRNKHTTTKQNGLLHPLPIPNVPFESIAIDVVSGFAPIEGKDAVLVVVDRLSHTVSLMPTSKTATAAQLAKLLIDNVICKHGIPKDIVSDMDARWTSEVWGEIFGRIGAKLNMATPHHQNADGLAERYIKTAVQVIRCTVDDNKADNWLEALPFTEFAINNTRSASIGMSPFQMLYGRSPNSPSTHELPVSTKIPPAVDVPTRYKRAREAILKAQGVQKEQTDKHRQETHFKVNDLVLLDAKMVSLPANAGKLVSLFVGPFVITEVHPKDNYTILLPAQWRKSPTVHVSKLKKYNVPIEVEEDETWHDIPVGEAEVREVLAEKKSGRTTAFFVTWKGKDMGEAEWVDAKDCLNAQGAIKRFRERSSSHALLRTRGTGDTEAAA